MFSGAALSLASRWPIVLRRARHRRRTLEP
jgi:hypothetical protein